MNAQLPTFMLLPDFGFAPGEDLQLGTILSLSSETKLPDPDIPLNSDERIPPSGKQIRRHVVHAWKFDRGTQTCLSAGLDADVPVFLPAGGGLGYGVDKSQTLNIECGLVETERFVPSPEYIAEALATDFIQDYCQRKWRPSVYLVTGLKIAVKATIRSGISHSHEGNIKAKVDATSFGVPINAGPSLEASSTGTNDTARLIEGPFILAYQLKRLRLSRKGAVKSAETFNKFALFDDDVPMEVSEGSDSWDVEDVRPDTLHDS